MIPCLPPNGQSDAEKDSLLCLLADPSRLETSWGLRGVDCSSLAGNSFSRPLLLAVAANAPFQSVEPPQIIFTRRLSFFHWISHPALLLRSVKSNSGQISKAAPLILSSIHHPPPRYTPRGCRTTPYPNAHRRPYTDSCPLGHSSFAIPLVRQSLPWPASSIHPRDVGSYCTYLFPNNPTHQKGGNPNRIESIHFCGLVLDPFAR
ncbi:hypothetical protein BDZ45DRAFT_121903 [Acephala macrosclerotiorum]|nr:hypothetical protein BDZ45DRAFT_121903 [Acephala macrosclerotiorum]